MPNNILLITGPAGAGKTTVADAWAKSRETRCAHLSLDPFRQLIKSGYHDPRLGWNDEAQRQLDIARSNIASVATRFIESGISCVIDDVVFPDWEPSSLDRWHRALGSIGIDLIAIIPQWGVERCQRRGGQASRGDAPEDLRRYGRVGRSSRCSGCGQFGFERRRDCVED